MSDRQLLLELRGEMEGFSNSDTSSALLGHNQRTEVDNYCPAKESTASHHNMSDRSEICKKCEVSEFKCSMDA